MKRRLTAVLTALCMLAAPVMPWVPDVMTALTVHAEESGTCGENLTWTLDDEGTLTISGTGEIRDYSWRPVKKVVIKPGVTSIGDYAFQDCMSLTSVTIPDSVTSIGDYAFKGCTSLTSATIPDSVTSIGDYAFCLCTSLTSVNIPDSVTSIGHEAFYDTAWLEAKQKENPLVVLNHILIDGSKCSGNITIPNSVTSIGDSAFYNCTSLTSATIPDSVTSIQGCAFLNCTSLRNITIPDSVTLIGGSAFNRTPWLEAKQKESPFVVVNHILIDGSTCSGDVIIPDNVPSIGDDAFYGCTDLTSVTIPNSVTNIIVWAFANCPNLKSVTILNPNCTIGNTAATFCNGNEWDSVSAPFTGTIYGYENSTAQAYAKKYGRKFEVIGSTPSTPTPTYPASQVEPYSTGDVTGDSTINAKDANAVLIAAAKLGTGNISGLSYEAGKAADVNVDGTINAKDANTILRYAAAVGTGAKAKIVDFKVYPKPWTKFCNHGQIK